ncbi:2-methylene-furan-3-one reductase [Aspergillus udagawae]|nr:2-methylene-furan-3-one reductase [Aspergillus udagawae]
MLSELPKPEIQDPKGVLIKVHAASVNPIDVKKADGILKFLQKDAFPYKIGYDCAVSGTGLYACQLAKHVFNAGKGDHHRLDIESCQGGRTVRRGNRRSEQVSRDTDRDVTSTGHKSTVDDEYVSEQETFTAEAEPRGGRQRAEQPSASGCAVDVEANNWFR